MSLATRCSACGTVFRVVQDQLRVSGGWVRCGRCAEVFNAIESLVDLEIDRPTADEDVGEHGSRVLEDLARLKSPAAAPPWTAAPASPAPPPATTIPTPVSDADANAVDHTAPDPAIDASSAADDDGIVAAAGGPSDTRETIDLPAIGPKPRLDLRGLPIVTVEPEFVRRAARAQRWRHPGVRVGLATLGLVLASMLAAQVMLAWHDLVAARWPGLAPMVERLCTWQGCVVEPPRRIDALIVDSSGLARTGPDDTYRLAIVMRNRDATMALRLPSIELTLTDAAGLVLSRRVLEPGVLGAAGNRIEAGAELPLSALVRIAGGSPAGYTIELFYP